MRKVEQPTVVVIDDNYLFLGAVTTYLTDQGYDAQPVLSRSLTPEEMVLRVQLMNPDVVITGVRNRDNTDEHDTSGILLAQALAAAGVPTIVNTTPEYESLVVESGYQFANKELGGRALLPIIELLLGDSTE